MRTRELADHAAVNPQTLRYYGRRGLLPQPPRSPAGYRDYPAAAVRVIGFIKRAQQLGFTLDQIGELLDLAQAASTPPTPYERSPNTASPTSPPESPT